MKNESPHIFDVDEAGFAEQVIEASRQGFILVDFWAEWCSPCLALAPGLERVVNGYQGAVRLAKVEVDDNMRLAGHYRLRGFPTVILFGGGLELGRFGGAHPAHWIRHWVQERLGQKIL